ncbi:hypothetical protein P279_21335 [Rhodobacteraceae bacterium PD-2]|nr:hypothetical protein P279_21335 [Rhodobacteraceae bacterium PD-2]
MPDPDGIALFADDRKGREIAEQFTVRGVFLLWLATFWGKAGGTKRQAVTRSWIQLISTIRQGYLIQTRGAPD